MRYIILKFEDKVNKEFNINELAHDLFNAVKIIEKEGFYILFTTIEKANIQEILNNLRTELLSDFIAYTSEKDETNYEKILSYLPKETRVTVLLDEKKLLITLIKQNKKIFTPKQLENLSFEMIETAKVFLENNQNISQAALKMYLHRNTLIQRLEKFRKETNYDLKKFEDAFIIYYFINL